MKLLFALLFTVAAVSATRRYDGYRLVDVGPLKDKTELSVLMSLIDNDERVRQVILMSDDISKTHPASLAVAPKAFSRLQVVLAANDISFTVVHQDIQTVFDKNMKENDEALARLTKNGKFDPTLYDHDAYLRYNDQIAYINQKVAASNIAETFNIGRSYEGREQIGVVINRNTNLPGYWIDANIHAREWITSATALYLIDTILNSNDVDAVYLRSNFRIYILPTLNPDGYEFCWTGDRMWRKTRSANAGSPCIGTDPNRNWDSNWCGAGADPFPCSDTYCGTAAFSERETANARDFLVSIKGHTDLFISLHSYSQYWLVPWGGYTFKPADYNELKRVGDLAAAALFAVNGRQFLVGTPPDILYVASGGSFDWAKETNGQTYAYSPELRPANAAGGGFDIPPSQILPSGQEVFASIVAVARNARSRQ